MFKLKRGIEREKETLQERQRTSTIDIEKLQATLQEKREITREKETGDKERPYKRKRCKRERDIIREIRRETFQERKRQIHQIKYTLHVENAHDCLYR